MNKEKQIKSSDWLTKGLSKEEFEKIKAEAVKEAEKELQEKQIEEMAKEIYNLDHCEGYKDDRGCMYAPSCSVCKYGRENKAKQISELLTKHGYRKADEVAREIFEEIEKTLNRKVARSKPQFEKLHSNEKDLSIWGYKDMGYFQGIISTCEDFQDIIAELKKKYLESEKKNGI